jgi:hypothetical protein
MLSRRESSRARGLEARHFVEQLVLPNEIHAFLRHESWLRADEATAEFLGRQLGVPTNK